jgi:hypothetical protein
VHRSLLMLLALTAALALPGAALAQSAGDEQYTDPFGDEPSSQQQEDPAPAPEQPAEPAPTAPAPAEGGNGTAEVAPTTESSQEASPALPRTGAPVMLFAAVGYALLLAGVAIRRKA